MRLSSLAGVSVIWSTMLLAGCGMTMMASPQGGSGYQRQAEAGPSLWSRAASAWSRDLADGTRPFACTEPRMAEIARTNTQTLLKMASGAPNAALPTLMGPQRRDQLDMPDGGTVEVLYYRSYVDSINTSMGYDIGLTPIAVGADHTVLAMGPAVRRVRAQALAERVLAYNSPCQVEGTPLTISWNMMR